MKRNVFFLALCAALMLCAVTGLNAAGLSGAIFTTVSDGTAVNANQYSSKCAVYLNGGPGPNAPAKAAGLPDGDYYFQVTDPSGKTLLSTDAVANRKFHVSNGVIIAYTGAGGPVHPTGVSQDHPELGTITIRLANASCPTDFADTPNNGGAYKAWVTPVSSFVGDATQVDNACGTGCFHGFIPSASKTDNFKAAFGTPTFCLTVEKQNSATGLSPVQNWPFQVTDPLGVVNSFFTDAAGTVQVCGLGEGAYTVAEDPGANINGLIVNGTSLPASTIYSFTWTAGQPAPVIIFQNFILF